ncbi:hypothetical protein BDN71DRAFT_1437087 [Pleurotus eryngii]|uniref:Uncharacterized protein n=1 Tax=Pleurotus eryngii TaxID=5323 RepID=A0A9P6D7Z2_PLEER|nr:hypothetical protein BDN71DRAFT_1437087 [Pleurotus eryngii]
MRRWISSKSQIRVNGLAVRVEVQMRYYCMIITQITSHGDMILIPLPALVRASPTPVNLRVSAILFLTVAEFNWDMMESSVTWQLKSIWMQGCSQERSLLQIEKAGGGIGWHEPQVHPPLHYILPNRLLREIQGTTFKERSAWRGYIIVTKYQDNPFSSMINASIADFPILKNYFTTRGSPSHIQCH